jgi:RNA polymerase sigma factor (sigma-70 family)
MTIMGRERDPGSPDPASGQLTTLQLIARILAGEDAREAEAALYGILEGALLERLRKRIPSQLRPRLDAEDILHTAFLRARARLDSFEAKDKDAFIGYVYRTAKNLILNAGDRRSVGNVRFAGNEDGAGGPRASQLPGKQGGHTSLVARDEWIQTFLGRLAPKEAEVIRLYDLEQRSYETIARAWYSTPGAVQKFHSRAMEKLRAIAEEAQG